MSNPPRSWLTYRPLRIGWHRRPEEDRPIVRINDLDRNPSQKNLKGNRCHSGSLNLWSGFGTCYPPASRMPAIIERILTLKRLLLAHMGCRSSGRTVAGGLIAGFRSPRAKPRALSGQLVSRRPMAGFLCQILKKYSEKAKPIFAEIANRKVIGTGARNRRR